MLKKLIHQLISKYHTCYEPPKSSIVLTMEALISDYDKVDLLRALSMLEHDLSWKILRAAMMKEYLNNVNYTLDMAGKSGTQIEAAYYAGVSQTLYNNATSLIDKYKEVLANKSNVVEINRPEE